MSKFINVRGRESRDQPGPELLKYKTRSHGHEPSRVRGPILKVFM